VQCPLGWLLLVYITPMGSPYLLEAFLSIFFGILTFKSLIHTLFQSFRAFGSTLKVTTSFITIQLEHSPLNFISIMAYIMKKLPAQAACDSAVPSSPSPFTELEDSSKPIMSAIQVSSTHDNNLQDNDLCVHRGRPIILIGLSAGPIVNVPLQTMSDSVWRCCKCTGLGNPALSPERCPLCGHAKCIYCNPA
jgi:hypothetical protein